ncbi:hypothetical protein IFM89_035863 [Coptis chinensis]|uniref:Uncharacterized protein n=1 Tax=Coptis chinensis TaxID=261450 RepID=A0A835LDH4_9MAGN|nr:hypothetical protein IFM89_035863 [Coptis chinensis]
MEDLADDTVRNMAIGAVFNDFGGKINSVDFHRTEDLLITTSEDDSVRLYDTANATLLKTTYHKKHGADRICFTHHPSSVICSSGILHLRGRPAVAYDQQGLVFSVAMEGGAIKLFDSRSYDKGPFDTFFVGGDTAEVSDIKFSNDGKSMLLTTTNNNIYVLDAYGGEKRCGFSSEPSPNVVTEATFSQDGQYVVSGSGDGNLHAWSINMRNENSHIGVTTCLKWAPRRVMFVAASTVLTFWIPNDSETNVEAGNVGLAAGI